MDLTSRGFIKLTGAALATSSMGALGFGGCGEAVAEDVRPFKLTHAKETRNTCTYCSVACGILIYTLGEAPIGDYNPVVLGIFFDPIGRVAAAKAVG